MDSNREINGSVKIEDSKIVLKMNGLEQVYVKTNVTNPKEWIVFLDINRLDYYLPSINQTIY